MTNPGAVAGRNIGRAITELETNSDEAFRGVEKVAGGLKGMVESASKGESSIRGIIGAVGAIAPLLGPAGPFVAAAAAIGELGFAVHDFATRDVRAAADSLARFKVHAAELASEGKGRELRQAARDLTFGTAFDEKGELRKKSTRVAGAFEDSLVDLEVHAAELRAKMKGMLSIPHEVAVENERVLRALTDARARAKILDTAISNLNSQVAEANVAPFVTTASARPKHATEAAPAWKPVPLVTLPDLPNGLSDGSALARTGIQTTPGAAPRGVPRIETSPLPLPKLPDNAQAKAFLDRFSEQVEKPIAETIRSGMANTLGSAVSAGISKAFETKSIGAGFKAAGKAMLAGLGDIFSQMGAAWVKYGVAMTSLGHALWSPFTSGPAAVAIGATLIALGSALGAVAHGGGPGGGGGGGAGGASTAAASAPQIIDRGLINPNNAVTRAASSLAPSAPMNVTVIGPNDPTVQRQLQELLNNGANRGTL